MIRTVRAVLFCASIALANPITAQENFIPGFILTDSDTIKGLIDDRHWDNTPVEIHFKKNVSDESISYGPGVIKGFGGNGRFFQSAKVDVVVPGNIDTPTPITESRDTFIEILFSGEKSLASFKSDVSNEWFYIGTDNGFELLTYKKYNVNSNGALGEKENKRYIGQLIVYLDGCSEFDGKLNDTKYSRRSLSKLFMHYFSCTGKEAKFQSRMEKFPLEFKVLAGVTNTGLGVIAYAPPEYMANTNFNRSTNPTIGIGLDIGSGGRIWLANDLSLITFRMNGTYNEFLGDMNYSLYDTKINCTVLRLRNTFQWRYPTRSATIFLMVGMFNGLALVDKNEVKKETFYFGAYRTTTEPALGVTSREEHGYEFGLGARRERYSLELRYEQGNDMSEIIRLKVNPKSFEMILGYRL